MLVQRFLFLGFLCFGVMALAFLLLEMRYAQAQNAEAPQAIVEFVALQAEDKAAFADPCAEYHETIRKGGGYLSVIIDDMGLSAYTARFIAIKDYPLTLSFLPYAGDLDAKVSKAQAAGHEVMLHMPMEAVGRQDREAYMVTADESHEESLQKIDAALARIKDVRGLNNHMGSRVTSDADKMAIIMDEVKKRGLFFVDSKTIASSVVERVAAEKGVPFIARDIFLDDANDARRPIFRLYQAARRAKDKGYAVAIGHPVHATYQDLKGFFKTMRHDKSLRHLRFVTISEAMRARDCLVARTRAKQYASGAVLAATEHHQGWVQAVLDSFSARYQKEF